MQLPYDDVAQILQFRHLTHGATHGLDIVEQHEQQNDGTDNTHDAKHLLNRPSSPSQWLQPSGAPCS